ncbi:MAG: hypothetical protein ABJQ71_15440 [Roseibium sp.]
MSDTQDPGNLNAALKEIDTQNLTKILEVNGFLYLDTVQYGHSNSISRQHAESLILIGSTGACIWPVFRNSVELTDGEPDPLDRFSKRVLGQIASDLGLNVVFPFEGPPFHPFQQWVLKSGGFSQSPLGVLVSEEFGPWVGFRGAILVPKTKSSKAATSTSGPCETCSDKPCLTACPVNAISLSGGYDVPKCLGYLQTTPGAECWSGCLARRACPFGSEYKQTPENARFHMESFVKLSES